MGTMFIKPELPIDNQQLFSELKGMIDNALSAANVESYVKALKYYGIQPRQFERSLQEKLFEQMPGGAGSKAAAELFAALSFSDQGQIREHYLSRIEEVPQELRAKYRKVFQYA
jgi:hypothetical protein